MPISRRQMAAPAAGETAVPENFLMMRRTISASRPGRIGHCSG
jgi:hypothetical protein